MVVLEPDSKLLDNMNNCLKALQRERAGATFHNLWSQVLKLEALASDGFIRQIKTQLQQVEQRSLHVKTSFPIHRVVDALASYQKLIQLYCAKAHLQSIESSEQFTAMIKSCDLQQLEAGPFEKHFTTISEAIPQPFQKAFGEHVDLAIACWAELAWPDRERLHAGFLYQRIFELLDTVAVKDLKLCWSPSPDTCPLALSDGKFRTAVEALLKSITTTCNVQLGYNEENWKDRGESVVSSCMQVWKNKNFTMFISDHLPILPSRTKPEDQLLLKMTLKEYRTYVREKGPNGQAFGGKEMLQHVLQHDPILHDSITASDLIDKLKTFINKHKKTEPVGPVQIVPVTCLSTSVYLLQIQSLADGLWISDGVLDFALMQHALNTGGCCTLFDEPLCVGPRVFYCDTTMFPGTIEKNKKWKYDIHNYDFIFIPAFVDTNHYIGLGVALSIKDCSGHLQSFDSLSRCRIRERSVVLAWLQREAPDIAWTHSEGICPQQHKNMVDCAILTFLSGTYFTVLPANGNLNDCYGLCDAAVVRKQLVLQSISVGNSLRSGTPWKPFS